MINEKNLGKLRKMVSQLDADQWDEATVMLNDAEAITAEQILRMRQAADDIVGDIHGAGRIRNVAFLAEMAWRACHQTGQE